MKPLRAHPILLSGGMSAFGALACLVSMAAGAPEPAQVNAPPPVGIYDVRLFGARGDGEELDTPAIQKAVDACAERGGGVVRLPPGRYLSGTIHLRSGVTLLLEAGATIVGTTNLAQYDLFRPPAGTPEARFRPAWHRALILGVDLEGVGIVGQGIIDGNKVFDPQGEERRRGPHTILLGNSSGITLRGISVVDSANYAVMLENCSDVEVREVEITGGWDGVHFRGWPGRPCRDVRILDCRLFTGDDAIAGRYWERVLISGCVINSSCNGLRLIGPAKDLIVHDCLFYGPGRYPHRTSNRSNMLAGINLQPGAWDRTEGLLDDVLLSDLTMRAVTTPFHFSLKSGNRAGRITVQRVDAIGVYRAACSVESWAETPFTNVVFRDVTIEFTGGGTLAQARREVRAPGVDARPLPAWGFFLRNVEELTLEDVRLRCARPDRRPAILAQDVKTLRLQDVRFPSYRGALGPLKLERVGEVISEDIPDTTPTQQ